MPSRPISLDSITVDRANRQRRTLNGIAELADSMTRIGLIHPIVVTRDNILIAGERRYKAALYNGWTHIEATYRDEIDRPTLRLIELEENIKREDLSWQDRNTAVIECIELRRQVEPTLSLESIGESIGLKKSEMSVHTTVARHREDPLISKADGLRTAYNIAVRKQERAKADVGLIVKPYTSDPIINADFNEWAATYTGSRFNLIHCDFPYGINAHQSAGQNSSLEVDYTDTPETYWQLFKTLSVHLDRFCADSAHMIFWFSPNVYCTTWEMLKLLDGFRFDEHPLVWQRGENEGIAPDPARRPRRVYEMAFFGWRGDRKIIRTKSNSVVAPTERNRHPHEKSEAALRHFFEMCVDNATAIFDPTCGSGSALRAAKSLGASRYLGLELNEEYASVARRAFQG